MFTGQLFMRRGFLHIACAAIFIFLFSSCTTFIKNYPRNKPFVYKTNINVIGNFTSEEKEILTTRLKAQLDDSMKVRSVSKILWSVMKNPPVYDSINADKSTIYMRSLLVALGYFKDTITYKAVVDSSHKDQYRTTVDFNVTPGKVVRIDSFAYNIKQAEMQSLATQSPGIVKKGDPFAKAAISLELDRLVELYRNNGYMRFGRELLIGLWDTLDIELLEPTLDPLEQLALLEKLRARRENPTADLEIRLRPGFDSTKLTKYYVGNITVYPDVPIDTTGFARKEVLAAPTIRVISYQNMFKPKIFPPNIFLRHNEVYDQRNYLRTINRFNSLNAWRLTNIEQVPRKNTDTADFVIRLTPAKKYSFVANLEGSRNNNAVSGNLLGIAINAGLQNRNFARAANQSSTNIRFGVETGRDTATDVKFIQTRQLSINHTFSFPRPIPRMKWLPENIRNSFRTVLAFNAALTERRELYNLNTVNGSWGYEFQWGRKFMTLRFPNIEYSSFRSQPRLDTIFKYNPSIRNIFSDGLISSMMAGVRVTGGRKKNINNLTFNVEVSGLLLGLIKNKFLDTNLYRFIKTDLDFAQKISLGRSALVLHGFIGIGYAFESTANENKRYNLPLLRQYFAGGPNSMRAWGLRKLGPGSSIKDFGTTGLPDRYGDLQLEGNIEYRFPFIKAFGINIEGAVFTDIGNIWFVKKPALRPAEEVFNFNRVGTDLAVGVGTGFRIDLSFFVIRLDYSIKAKDPSPSPVNAAIQNKWFGYKK
ncbi:MAG TPA: BamA/TamA family outer membrane protein, partial [Chitinophagaceae bacterium]|nr:BamA/TamA family outer membrane protein [Chitinophagaceae bacterium]